ncbi:MAG: 50S ribosomal protein L9 [Dehalococcoidia bacterium]
MKVVFLEEVEGTARTGDVKNVANGFARNFLLPRKLAAPATDHYIAIAQSRATKQARVQTKLDEDAQKLMPLVDGKELTIEVRVGEQDKLFGSVTARDVTELLQAETKIDLEHKQVDIKQPIRELGSHQVPVKLTRNVIAMITVHVIPIGGSIEDLTAEAETEAASEVGEGDVAVAEAVTEEVSSESETGEEVPSAGGEDEEEKTTEDDAEQTDEEPEIGETSV